MEHVYIDNSNHPLLCVECKIKDENPTQAMKYFINKFPDCKAWHITLEGKKEVSTKEGIHIAPVEKFLAEFM